VCGVVKNTDITNDQYNFYYTMYSCISNVDTIMKLQWLETYLILSG
jgi:hypothetical protein